MPNKVGKHLKLIRNVMRLSQKNFAEYLEVSLRSYEKWEQGSRLPDLCSIMKIAEKLNVSIDWLLGRERLFLAYFNDRDFFKKYFVSFKNKKGDLNEMFEENNNLVHIEKIKELIKDKDINKIKIKQIEQMAASLNMPVIDFFNILLELLNLNNK